MFIFHSRFFQRNLSGVDSDASRQSFAQLVSAAISEASNDSIVPCEAVEDSDDWLNIDARDFDEMLENTIGSSGKRKASINTTDLGDQNEDKVAKHQATRLQDLADKVKSFVGGEGDIEGARFTE
jgi:hypothetical protein